MSLRCGGCLVAVVQWPVDLPTIGPDRWTHESIRVWERSRRTPEDFRGDRAMPIATPEKYAEMLDTAKKQSFAFPAINVSSSQTLNAALAGFAEAGSDGILQVS